MTRPKKYRGVIPSVAKPGMSLRDFLTHKEYSAMWTFISVYGEQHFYDVEMNSALEPRMDGRCVSGSWMMLPEFERTLSDFNGSSYIGYAEGLSSEHPLTLHAWNVWSTQKHKIALDTTWVVEDDSPVYYGVEFNKDFFEWVRKKQYDGKLKDTLPYLGTGCCCLTYKPLLEGKISDYPLEISRADTEYGKAVFNKFVSRIKQ